MIAPEAAGSRSDDDSSGDEATTITINKPKPLQVDDATADTGTPLSATSVGGSGMNDAQSPLFYVPSAILYTPHTSHTQALNVQQQQQQHHNPLSVSVSNVNVAAPTMGSHFVQSPIALGSYPRYSSPLSPQANNSGVAVNVNNGTAAAAAAPFLFAPLNYPQRSSSDQEFQVLMAQHASILSASAGAGVGDSNSNLMNSGNAASPTGYVYGSPLSPIQQHSSQFSFSPLASPMSPMIGITASPPLTSMFGLPSPSSAAMNYAAFDQSSLHGHHSHSLNGGSAFSFNNVGGNGLTLNGNDSQHRANSGNKLNGMNDFLFDSQQWAAASVGLSQSTILNNQRQANARQRQHHQQGAFESTLGLDIFGQSMNAQRGLHSPYYDSHDSAQQYNRHYANAGVSGVFNTQQQRNYYDENLLMKQRNAHNYRQQQQMRQAQFGVIGMNGANNVNSGMRVNHSNNGMLANGTSPTDSLSATLTVDAIVGQVVRLAKTHSGSRLMQHKLESKDPTFFPVLFRELKSSIIELACDNFAHFAVEKLIAASNEEQVSELLEALAPAFNAVACQKHGSFACQSMVDACITVEQQRTLAQAIENPHGEIGLLQLCLHASGHFVVLRMLERLSPQCEALECIDRCLSNNAMTIGADHHGLRVVKAFIASRPHDRLIPFYQAIIEGALTLASTAFGNYTVQACLEHADSITRSRIRAALRGHYAALSKQKFSSNVVEHCLKHTNDDWKRLILIELCAQPGVAELLRDRYGNYVLQSAVSVAQGKDLQSVIDAISPHLASLRENVRHKWKAIIARAQQQLMMINAIGAATGNANSSSSDSISFGAVGHARSPSPTPQDFSALNANFAPALIPSSLGSVGSNENDSIADLTDASAIDSIQSSLRSLGLDDQASRS